MSEDGAAAPQPPADLELPIAVFGAQVLVLVRVFVGMTFVVVTYASARGAIRVRVLDLLPWSFATAWIDGLTTAVMWAGIAAKGVALYAAWQMGNYRRWARYFTIVTSLLAAGGAVGDVAQGLYFQLLTPLLGIATVGLLFTRPTTAVFHLAHLGDPRELHRRAQVWEAEAHERASRPVPTVNPRLNTRRQIYESSSDSPEPIHVTELRVPTRSEATPSLPRSRPRAQPQPEAYVSHAGEPGHMDPIPNWNTPASAPNRPPGQAPPQPPKDEQETPPPRHD